MANNKKPRKKYDPRKRTVNKAVMQDRIMNVSGQNRTEFFDEAASESLLQDMTDSIEALQFGKMDNRSFFTLNRRISFLKCLVHRLINDVNFRFQNGTTEEQQYLILTELSLAKDKLSLALDRVETLVDVYQTKGKYITTAEDLNLYKEAVTLGRQLFVYTTVGIAIRAGNDSEAYYNNYLARKTKELLQGV